MQRARYFIPPALLVTASAHAGPIDIGSFPPRPDVFSALMVEVLVVALIIWRFRLRMVPFLVAWSAINLLTFYFVLGRLLIISRSVIIGELAVFVVEATALYGLSRLSFFKSVKSKPIPLGWVVGASVAGNVSSILAFIGIMALE